MVELDHLFVCAAAGAPEAEALKAFGLLEGSSNTHPGQGTANRRFFFRGAMLELLWVHDEEQTRSPAVAPTRLWERWCYRSTGYSPFGICLRADKDESPLPFETWDYRPPYLPPGTSIEVAAGTANEEPMLFATPFGARPDAAPAGRREPLDHPAGLEEITAVGITLPHREVVSPALRAMGEIGSISFVFGGEHLLEIGFDHGAQGRAADFRPMLPMVVTF